MARQQRIKETVQEIPPDVQEAIDNYLKPKRQIAKLRGKMNEWKETLVTRMKDHKLEEVEIDDGDAVIQLQEDAKLHIEKLKKDKGGDKGGDEE